MNVLTISLLQLQKSTHAISRVNDPSLPGDSEGGQVFEDVASPVGIARFGAQPG